MDNKVDFFVAKLANGQTSFDAVATFNGVPLVDLLQFITHYRDSIEFSGNNRILVRSDQLAAQMKQKLAAIGLKVEPLRISRTETPV